MKVQYAPEYISVTFNKFPGCEIKNDVGVLHGFSNFRSGNFIKRSVKLSKLYEAVIDSLGEDVYMYIETKTGFSFFGIF